MQKVKINFENCFGIKKFSETLDFRRQKCVLIYSPNGTMKTSFAETMRMIGAEKSNQIKDRMNPSKPVVCELKDETGADIAAKNKIGFVSPARRYEAPTVVRPPQM